ncbi:hypothetical protein AK812_SmicGene45910 [Symbiodinium microadriaticum]|uniref:Uncharacterized protein n=1 Tax=Symbiodinium microadriaticum TaxID=2951 RepID=A0A1Q9BV23_SYMMI|nr:hypothetical protein AK812_SmicGene45910 [Symbiodinium microadriaticum]CAE7769162.1 unnamed protein product [Symbiodinium microadriaticum]
MVWMGLTYGPSMKLRMQLLAAAWSGAGISLHELSGIVNGSKLWNGRLPWRTMATCGLLGMGLVTTSRRGCCLDSVVFVAQQVLYYDFATTPSTVVLSWLRRLWL